MWRRCIGFLLSIMLLLQVGMSYGALDLVLTKGIAAAIPFAIAPFSNSPRDVAGGTTLSEIVANDLNNSGQFRQIKPMLGGTDLVDLSHFNAAYWKKQGVRDLIVGQVKTAAPDRYQVSVQLVDVNAALTSKASTLPQQAILLQRTLLTNQTGLRHLAHQISDAVYQKLTGVRGIFATKIAYLLVSNKPGAPKVYALEIADADGFNPRAILRSYQPIMSPAWSPDGRHIAYVSFENNEAAIYIQDIGSGSRKRVSEYPGVNGAPAYSPDGTKLALVLTRTGNPKIYVMDLGSGQLTQITRGSSIDTEPAWAPDGKSIVFTSNRGGNPQIYRYYFSNRQVQRLTFDGNYNARASFFPSGTGLVMMHRQTGLFGIAKQNLTTGRVQALVQSGDDESPSLAPNGKMVLYATRFAGRGVLALVSIDGRVKLRLPAREGSVREPAWSPFSST